MIGVMFTALVNLSFGFVLSVLLVKFPEHATLLIGAALFICLLVMISTYLLMSSKEELKKAADELKEGEVHSLLRSCSAREAGSGVIAIVRSNTTHELKMLIFEKDPPPLFEKQNGQIIAHLSRKVL